MIVHVLFVPKKIGFKEKSLNYFLKKFKIKKKNKKNPKNVFSGFFNMFFGVFCVGFLGGFFIANPAYLRGCRGVRIHSTPSHPTKKFFSLLLFEAAFT
jgi:hypothetical protein